VACFVKQLGSRPWWDGCTVQWIGAKVPKTEASALNKENGWIVFLKDRKGGDMAEWPKSLRVREFPIEAQ
jgi:hypothetical protein